MTDREVQRRLAAVVAADVAGYTHLMEKDTEGTVAAWHAARDDIIDPMISEHSGRIVKHTGDGFLAEFPTVQDAVRSAVAMQKGLKPAPLEFRMGINLGDIIDDGEDIHGDGINVAARLEAICDPGGVYISGDVYSQVRRRLDFEFEDLGEREMKHISTPVHVYKIVFETPTVVPPTLPDKPSIAVLPFDNLSGDPEQEYFSDGIAEDIITDLSKSPELLVIARTSSFTFKGQNIGVKEIGEQLGVRYILEGSVRKAGNKVRINAQLVDAPTDGHVWAERYDGELEDIFSLQDEINAKIVSALKVSLSSVGKKDGVSSLTTDVETYDLYLRGRKNFYVLSPEHVATAKQYLEQVLGRDPNFAPAHAMISYCYFIDWNFVASSDDGPLKKALEVATKAVDIDPTGGYAHARLAWIKAFMREFDESLKGFERALVLAPNDPDVLAYYGETLNYADQPKKGLEMIEQGMRLDPLGPPSWEFHLGHSYYKMGRHDEAISFIRQSMTRGPEFPVTYLYLAVLYSELDRNEEAEQMVQLSLGKAPNYSIATIARVIPHKSDKQIDRFLGGLRKAGMPEG